MCSDTEGGMRQDEDMAEVHMIVTHFPPQTVGDISTVRGRTSAQRHGFCVACGSHVVTMSKYLGLQCLRVVACCDAPVHRRFREECTLRSKVRWPLDITDAPSTLSRNGVQRSCLKRFARSRSDFLLVKRHALSFDGRWTKSSSLS